MKHLLPIAITCAACAISTTASAQGPMFGVKGGLNYSTLAVDEADEERSRLGYHIGLFARSAPSEQLGLQVELLYSTKGSSTTYNALFGLIEQEIDFRLNYVELPIMASLRVAEIVDFQLGAYAAYLLSARGSSSGDLGSGSDELDRDNFKSMDFGLGGGVAFNVGPSAQFGIRYMHGLTRVADSEVANLFLRDATNRCVQLYVAVGVGQ